MRLAIIAGALFSSLLFAQPADPAAEAERARQLVAGGKLDEGIRIYQALARSSPPNPVLLLNLCVAEFTAKRYADSAAHASAALQLAPGLIEARLFLGASQLELGEFPAAVDSLTAVVAAKPGERNARLLLGEALLNSGQPAQAVEQLRRAAEMLPANPRVWYALGQAHERLGQAPAARQAWERLSQLLPSLESHLHAASVEKAAGRWREAALEWREALRLAPEKSAVRVALGEALFRSRDYPAAIATLEPLLGAKNPEVEFLYGASLLNQQQPLDAIPRLEAAIAGNPDLLPARAALGQALLQTGKVDAAIPLLLSGVAADQDGSVHFQLFRAYQLAHRETDARKAMADYQRFRASLDAGR
jgi:predicted Zn-dependent protease